MKSFFPISILLITGVAITRLTAQPLAPREASESTAKPRETNEVQQVNAPRQRPNILTQEQQLKLMEGIKNHEKEFRKIQQEMVWLQAELGRLSLQPKLDEEKIRARAEALGKVQAEDMILRARIYSELVVPTLTPEQRYQIEISLDPPMPVRKPSNATDPPAASAGSTNTASGAEPVKPASTNAPSQPASGSQ